MVNKMQEYDQEQDFGTQFSTAEPLRLEKDRATVIERLLETNPVLEQINNFLLGYYMEGKQLKQDKKLMLINERGCRSILFEVSLRISTPAILGTVTEEEAKKRAELFEKYMAQKMVNNFIDWEIPNTTAMDIIVDTLGDLIFVAMTRPISGSTFGGIVDMSQIRQHTLQRDVVPEQEKTGFLRGLFGKKEKGDIYGGYS